MPNGFGSRRKGQLKKTLGIPEEEDKVLTGRGQNVQQDSPVVSNKALEQQTVGVRKRGRSTLRRPEEVPFSESQLTPKERFRLDAPRGAKKAVREGQGELATLDTPREIVEPELKAGEGRASSRVAGGARRRGGFTELQKQKPGVVSEGPGPQGGGLNFNIADFKGIDNIFSSAGNLAAFFSSPAFQAQQLKARGASARRRSRTAQTKATNERVKALSTALENIPDIEGNEDVRNLLTSQITDIITNGSEQDDPVLRFATLAKSRNFPREEISSLSQRLFGGENG
jgi:hypothetical protein